MFLLSNQDLHKLSDKFLVIEMIPSDSSSLITNVANHFYRKGITAYWYVNKIKLVVVVINILVLINKAVMFKHHYVLIRYGDVKYPYLSERHFH